MLSENIPANYIIDNKSEITYFDTILKSFEPIRDYTVTKYAITKNGNGFKNVLYAMLIDSGRKFEEVTFDIYWNELYNSFSNKIKTKVNDLYVYYNNANEKNDPDVRNYMNEGIKQIIKFDIGYLELINQIPLLFTNIVAQNHNDGVIAQKYINGTYKKLTYILNSKEYANFAKIDIYVLNKIRDDIIKIFDSIIPKNIENIEAYYKILGIEKEFDINTDEQFIYNSILKEFNNYYNKSWKALKQITKIDLDFLFQSTNEYITKITSLDYFKSYMNTLTLLQIQDIENEIFQMYGDYLDNIDLNLQSYYSNSKLDTIKFIYSIENILNQIYPYVTKYMTSVDKYGLELYGVLIDKYSNKDKILGTFINEISSILTTNEKNILSYITGGYIFNRTTWYTKYQDLTIPKHLFYLHPLKDDKYANSTYLNKYFNIPSNYETWDDDNINLFYDNNKPTSKTIINLLLSMNRPKNAFLKKMVKYIWNEWNNENLINLSNSLEENDKSKSLEENDKSKSSKKNDNIFKPFPTTIKILENKFETSINNAFENWDFSKWRWPFYIKTGSSYIKIYHEPIYNVFYYLNNSNLIYIDFLPTYYKTNNSYSIGITGNMLRERIKYNDPMTKTEISNYSSYYKCNKLSCLTDLIVSDIGDKINLGGNYYSTIPTNKGIYKIFYKDDFYYQYHFNRMTFSVLSDETITMEKRTNEIKEIKEHRLSCIKKIQKYIVDNNLYKKCLPMIYNGSFLLDYMPYDAMEKILIESKNGTFSEIYIFSPLKIFFILWMGGYHVIYYPNISTITHTTPGYVITNINGEITYKTTSGLLILQINSDQLLSYL